MCYKIFNPCWLESLGASLVKSETGPCIQRARRDQERGSHSRLVGGTVKQKKIYNGDLSQELQDEQILPLPTSILRVYGEAEAGFSHIYHPHGLNDTLLPQGCVIENGSRFGNGGWNIHSKDAGEGGVGGEEPGSSSWVNWQSSPLMTSSNNPMV